jgi:hypothetical protein
MKKLMIASLFVFGCIATTFGQTKVTKEVLTQTTLSTQDYVEVIVSELPQPVLDAVSKDFEEATISKAWKNAKGEYKLEVVTADKQTLTLHSNGKGEWIKKQ